MPAKPNVRCIALLPLLGLAALLAIASPASAPAAQPSSDESLWSASGLAKMVDAYHQALPGKIRVLDLKIYANRAHLQAQDPAKPENVDQYDYHGRVKPPIPVRLHGHGSLDANLFDLDEVAFDRIPALVEEALTRVPLEGGEVTHIIVRRNLPFSKSVEIWVYLNGTRKSGILKADAKGRVFEAKSH